MMSRVREEVKGAERDIELSEAARAFLAKEGFDPVYGARPLRRAIQKYIEDPLAEEFLRNRFEKGSLVLIDLENDKIVFRKKEQPAHAGMN